MRSEGEFVNLERPAHPAATTLLTALSPFSWDAAMPFGGMLSHTLNSTMGETSSSTAAGFLAYALRIAVPELLPERIAGDPTRRRTHSLLKIVGHETLPKPVNAPTACPPRWTEWKLFLKAIQLQIAAPDMRCLVGFQARYIYCLRNLTGVRRRHARASSDYRTGLTLPI